LLWAELVFGPFNPEDSAPVIEAHRAVTALYNISHVSAYHALQANLSSMQEWLRTYYKWDYVHPSLFGHKLAAQIVGHYVAEQGEPSAARPQSDMIPLQQARWVPTEIDEAYQGGRATRYDMRSYEALAPNIVFNGKEDVANGPLAFTVIDDSTSSAKKPGLTAAAEDSMLLLGFKVPDIGVGPAKLFISLGLLKSWKDMGAVDILFRTSPSENGACHQATTFNGMDESDITKALGGLDELEQRHRIVDCLWASQTSTYVSEHFRFDAPDGHSCLWMRTKVVRYRRDTNKIKVFDLSVISISNKMNTTGSVG
jgi:hypothetical protein